MKLRIKLINVKNKQIVQSAKESVTVSDNCSLAAVRQVCQEALMLHDRVQVEISLNGSDVVKCENDALLSSLGVVTGDLIYLHGDFPVNDNSNNSDFSSGNQSQTCTNDVSSSAGAATIPLSDREMQQLSHIQLVEASNTIFVPEVLQQLYEHVLPKCRSHALLLPLHCLCQETGLVAKMPQARDQLMAGLDVRGVVQLSYCLAGHTSQECHLTCVRVGQLLVVHGRPGTEQSATCKVTLNPMDFVTDLETKAACSRYKSLRKLSRYFKDAICLPLRASLRKAEGYREEGFNGLPTELKLRILCCLSGPSLLQMSAVSHELYTLAMDPAAWRAAYVRDFGGTNNMSGRRDWRTIYRERYAARHQWRHQMPLPQPLDIPDPFVPLRPVYPPSVIGGDYDLDPFTPSPLFPHAPHFGPSTRPQPRPRWMPTDPSRRFPFSPGAWQPPF